MNGIFKNLFKRLKPIEECHIQNVAPSTFSLWEHRGWGDSINWQDWEKRSLYGLMTPKPKVRDILRAKMESGKIARFEFTEVREMADPKDMFFATVRDLEYEK